MQMRSLSKLKINIFKDELYRYDGMQSFSHSEKNNSKINNEKRVGTSSFDLNPSLGVITNQLTPPFLKIQYWNQGLKLITGVIDH